MSATCPAAPASCEGGGRTFLRDDLTGACCEYPCWQFAGEGFTAFRDRAQCEALPECNGSPVGTVLPAGDGCNSCTCNASAKWDCTQINCSGSAAGKTCGYFQGGCASTQYCAFVPADSCSDGDAPSVCLERPASCTGDDAKVCGCDGRDYTNRCEAARAGTGLRTGGTCSSFARCADTSACRADEYCPAGGFCVKRPLGCVNELDRVCGKNGVEYGNRCLAAQAGVDVRNSGACKPDCSGADDCAPDESCSACSHGQCLPRPGPLSCTTTQVVCGCDGQSYGCPALTASAGTAVAHEGPCP